ncbi:hypothetical protein LY90DRAFT_221420 [Neocallimastix californiae]|uniref:Uncharacterized protein n=1 Tax=Neocallimastix californiae TaxID=1754190 RepID=A0A1Y2FKS4_9FUNG|nr:hypothetical protein LY90DRAFT_221420 [Neocallimastix californiae]|eukprot:ORY84582.1 hypothetical protein LY90DRAFT_221420 [Neocallimastix californiae]
MFSRCAKDGKYYSEINLKEMNKKNNTTNTNGIYISKSISNNLNNNDSNPIIKQSKTPVNQIKSSTYESFHNINKSIPNMKSFISSPLITLDNKKKSTTFSNNKKVTGSSLNIFNEHKRSNLFTSKIIGRSLNTLDEGKSTFFHDKNMKKSLNNLSETSGSRMRSKSNLKK